MDNQIFNSSRHCPKCQTETERDARGDCKECKRAYKAVWKKTNQDRVAATMEVWRSVNQDKVKATMAAWRAANQDKVKANKTAWYAANPEKKKAMSDAYYAANKDKARATNAARYAANPSKANANSEAWRKANPEATRIHKQNRRARKLAAGGALSKGLTVQLLAFQRGKCPCCKQPLGDDYHLDHVIPLALGGSNTDDNMQLLRKTCNLQKHAKHPIDFMQSRGFLL